MFQSSSWKPFVIAGLRLIWYDLDFTIVLTVANIETNILVLPRIHGFLSLLSLRLETRSPSAVCSSARVCEKNLSRRLGGSWRGRGQPGVRSGMISRVYVRTPRSLKPAGPDSLAAASTTPIQNKNPTLRQNQLMHF